MMMARSWTQTLSRLSISGSESAGRCPLVPCKPSPASIRSSIIRHRSDQPIAAVDMDADSTAASSGGDMVEMEVEPQPPPPSKLTSTAMALRLFDEEVHRIRARRSAPDWLPLVPGSSYWVPPLRRPPSEALFELLSKLKNSLSNEEVMSLTTSRGWPSSAFYLRRRRRHPHQGAPHHSVKLEISSKKASDSEEDK